MAPWTEWRGTGTGLLRAARGVGGEISAARADDVDASARLPHESIQAMRDAGVLGAYVPARFGADGFLRDVSALDRVVAGFLGGAGG